MDVPMASRIMVTFKRGIHLYIQKTNFQSAPGPHKIESKSFPSLDNGIAIFDETLLMHSTLYYDKKKQAFLSKEVILFFCIYQSLIPTIFKATLMIFTVSIKGSKVAGQVKFDLADLPNSNAKGSYKQMKRFLLIDLYILERRFVWPILECGDSKAAIQVTLRNLQTEELSGKHIDRLVLRVAAEKR